MPTHPRSKKTADLVYWHSAALFISDNVATQIDGLAHITAGKDFHWYNGFKEEDWGSDWGPRKCDAPTIPPIVARGVLIDVAAYKKVERSRRPHLDIDPGSEGHAGLGGREPCARRRCAGAHRHRPVLGRRRRRSRHDRRARLRRPDLEATKWLVAENGAIMVGSDTSGYEVNPPPRFEAGDRNPSASLSACRSRRSSGRVSLS